MAKKKKKENKKKKKEEERQLKTISSNKILVRVFKDFGSNTAILKAEYEAEERRDVYNNLISINKQFLHDEDTDFTVDDVYHEMAVLLEFSNKDTKQKIEIIEKKIEFQKKLIQYLEKYPEINAVYNYADENLKLHDYKLLREYTQNIWGEGAYFTIEKGMRVYSFDSVDGFLVPVWRGVARHTQYPDHTRKKKIIIQEDIILQQELQKYNINRKLGNLLVWGIIAITILFAINVWWSFKNLEINTNLEEKINAPGRMCVDNIERMGNLFADALEKNLISKEDVPVVKGVQGNITAIGPKEIG